MPRSDHGRPWTMHHDLRQPLVDHANLVSLKVFLFACPPLPRLRAVHQHQTPYNLAGWPAPS